MPVQSVKKTVVKPIKKTSTKLMPVGVKIIAILYYIGAVLVILAALGFLLGGAALAGFAGAIPGLEVLGGLGAGLFIVGGIILIALAVLLFFIGKGLWKGVNWTRIAVIILSAIGIVSAIVSIINGEFGATISLVIHVIIGGYLLFNKTVKQAFA